MQDGNNIIVFTQSEGYIRLEKGTHATSKQLYGAYSQWCEDNLEKPLGSAVFPITCGRTRSSMGLTIPIISHSAPARPQGGFKGIHVKVRTGENGH